MTIDQANQLLAPQADSPIKILANKRYQFPHPDTGKTTTASRATTIAGLADDKTLIHERDLRMVGIGVARRPSIAAKFTAAGDDRQALRQAVDEALEAAGANEARELGSALHRISERVDAGTLELDDIPDPWRATIANYRHALRSNGLAVHPDYIERLVYNQPLGVAGTLDRLYVDSDGQFVVGDIKTGGFQPWLSWATQLALYATATHMWDPHDQVWLPMPPVRTDHALIVHLPAQQDWCRIHGLSIPVGYDNALFAIELRKQRNKSKQPVVTATTWQPPALVMQPATVTMGDDPHDVWRAWLVDRIETIKAFDNAARQLAAAWPAGVATFKRSDRHDLDELAAIEHAVNTIERAHQLPFPASRPAGIPALDDAHRVAA